MNAWSQPRRGSLLSTALARAEAWLVEPPSRGAASPAPPVTPRPVAVVRGLAPRAGASAVARALAAALARADPAGAAVVVGGPAPIRARIAAPPAARLARVLIGAGCDGVRASGRVCLVRDGNPLGGAVEQADAPVVIDVDHGSPPSQGLGYADLVVLVSSPAVAGSLVDAVEASLAGAGHLVEVVANRVGPEDLPRSARPGRLVIGESRLAAQFALTGREARGAFATPIAELAQRCRAAAP